MNLNQMHRRLGHYAATAHNSDGTFAARRWFLHEAEATAWANSRRRFYATVTVTAAEDVR